MGVSGSGKSTVAERLAAALGARFVDADTFHPPENIAKMSRGEPLNDEDRAGWLKSLRIELDAAEQRGERCVLACSALKQRYRDSLGVQPETRPLVYLEVKEAVAARRVAARNRHFMSASLVNSQFAALEEPVRALRIDATLPLDTIVNRVLAALSCKNTTP
jgi:gluconokinase